MTRRHGSLCVFLSVLAFSGSLGLLGLWILGNIPWSNEVTKGAAALAPDLGAANVARNGGESSSMFPSWNQFRGQQSTGVSRRTDLPKMWSPDRNLLWESQVPGRGASSPISIGNRIFITSASGYGEVRSGPEQPTYLKQHLFCLNAETGETLWRRDIAASPLTTPLNHQIFRHGYATSTPVGNGANVYAFFGASGVFAFDNRGEQLWHADVGAESSPYGSAASPLLFRNLLLINASAESGALIALDARNGRGLWRIDDVRDSWSTPVIGRNDRGDLELLVADDGRLRGFDLENGRCLWSCDTPAGYTASTPFTESGICYLTVGLKRTLMAVRLGGQGDVTQTHVLWKTDGASRHTSPTYLTGHVFVLNESGIFKCYDANNGQLVAQQRIPTHSRIYSSPILAGNYFYLPTDGNRVFVCRANPSLELLRDNEIDRDQTLLASLCPSTSSLLIRTDKSLYCVSDYRGERTVVSPPASQRPEIVVPPRFEYDVQLDEPRGFTRLIQRDDRLRIRAILDPLRDQISYAQRLQAERWISEESLDAPLHELRQQHRDTVWQKLVEPETTPESLRQARAQIEAQALVAADEIRGQLLSRLETVDHLRDSGSEAIVSR